MTAQEHKRLLGIFFLIQAVLSLVTNLGVAAVVVGMGFYLTLGMSASEAGTNINVVVVAGAISVIVIVIFSVLFAVAGWKLYKRERSGRIVGIVASILSLINFPLGTVLGIYGLWFFFGELGKELFEKGATGNPPPPPSTWR